MKKEIHITVFCDESKKRKVKSTEYSDSENWNYIGICIVPTSKIEVISKNLNKVRCGDKENYLTCIKNCKYHEKNKRKIHFTDTQDGLIYNTATKWTDYLVDNYKTKDFYINILGIDYCKLDRRLFKSNTKKTKVEENIYCRFFRSAILFGIKHFLADYDVIIVDNIIHDISEMENHKYFKKQIINYTKWKEEKIVMNCKEIKFLQTDNNNCMNNENTLLQLIDLFLGETINLIHNDAKNEKKRELSLKVYSIIDHCLNRPNNSNSNYYKIYYISFFPKYKISDDMNELDKRLLERDNFYNKREIKLCASGEQLSLF